MAEEAMEVILVASTATYFAGSERPTSRKAVWMSRRVEYSETEAAEEAEELQKGQLSI